MARVFQLLALLLFWQIPKTVVLEPIRADAVTFMQTAILAGLWFKKDLIRQFLREDIMQ